jgi:hypothetical protein
LQGRASPLYEPLNPEGLAADSDADPGCNISTVTGVGFIVLDLDVKDGIDGIATTEAIERG